MDRLMRPWRGWMTVALGVVLASVSGGCGTRAGVIFPPVENAPRWPAEPQPARISYVGQLVSSADLKPGRSFFQVLGDALLGKKEVRSMLSPVAVCTDGGQRVFVADSNAQVVHVFDLDSRRYEQWRPAEPQKFSQPVGLAWDAAGKRLLVADSMAETVFVFDESGRFSGSLGKGMLRRPCGVLVDGARGRVLVSDVLVHQVVVLSSRGELLARLGKRGTAPGEFNYPTYLAMDRAGRLYVSDSLNFRVQQFSADLKPLRQIGQQGDMPGQFSHPKGMAVDSEDHLYVVDAHFEAVQIFDAEGRLLLNFGREGRGPGEFWLPNGIFIDGRDRLWTADVYNRRLQVFDYHREAKP